MKMTLFPLRDIIRMKKRKKITNSPLYKYYTLGKGNTIG